MRFSSAKAPKVSGPAKVVGPLDRFCREREMNLRQRKKLKKQQLQLIVSMLTGRSARISEHHARRMLKKRSKH